MATRAAAHLPKTWLIAVASGGLGRELAKAALDSGDRVVATARRPEQLADLVQQYGGRIRTVALDVTDPAAVQMAIDSFGSLDVVVNGDGRVDRGP